MEFNCHCRDCNVKESAVVALQTLDSYLIECQNSLVAALCLFVSRTIHKECSGNIGVRAK